METSHTVTVQNESGVTEKMAVIKIEGQEFELEAVLAGDDKMLKTVLQPHYSSVENAQIAREVKDGRLIVSIVKRAQAKGARRVEEHFSTTPFEFLCGESERINPAIILAEELMRKDLAEILDFEDLARAQNTLADSLREIEAAARAFEALAKTPATASERNPIGF
jgi:hypothetical protein